MEVREAVKARRSIRRFRPDPVPREIIEQILEDARWSPSWGNTQPWEFYILVGEPLARFKEANRRRCIKGVAPAPEISMPELWPRALKARYVGVGRSVLCALGIARENRDARNEYYGEMFSLFGAQCLIVTCIDCGLNIEYAMLDVGLVNQTICLLAHERGLGTCMLAASVRYPDLLRNFLPIPPDRLIVIGTALGYPDWDSPVNQFQRERAGRDELVIWTG